MPDETEKTKKLWGDFEYSLLQGDGIDIGVGGCPSAPGVLPFDQKQGDANHITDYVDRQFDFVYSSHCLEHMHDARAAIQEWWKLVKPGGVLFLIVPDEDLYEQGFWPSHFNPDHKWTFTLSKRKSWSPVSINILDLVKTLQGSELLKAELHDLNYRRDLLGNGYRPGTLAYSLKNWFLKKLAKIFYKLRIVNNKYDLPRPFPIDQTRFSRIDVLAQIQCVVRKRY
jgi:SAM-dependent methyltransferase